MRGSGEVRTGAHDASKPVWSQSSAELDGENKGNGMSRSKLATIFLPADNEESAGSV
jgi:hypothetical protein